MLSCHVTQTIFKSLFVIIQIFQSLTTKIFNAENTCHKNHYALDELKCRNIKCYLFPSTTISAVTSSIIIVIGYYYPYQHMIDFFRQIVATINHINEAHGIVCLWFVVRWRNCPHHHHPWVNFFSFFLWLAEYVTKLH